MRHIIAHDLGTTGNKATLYSERGEMKASAFSAYDTEHLGGNRVEQNPQDWWRAVCESSRELIEKADINIEEIAVISFSGQMMGCVPVDRDARALRQAIIWADQRSTEEERELKEKIGADRGYRITGHRLSASYSGAKIRWLRKNEREVYEQTYKFLQPKDYIIARLTGKFATEYSDASGTNLLHLEDMEWSEEIVSALDIDLEKLPELKYSTEVAGELTKQAAEEVGLNPGIPVVMGGGDGATASVGAGSVDEGQLYNYLGSSSWIALTSDEPIYDEEKKTFNWVHVVPDKYIPCGTMQSAGASYAWLRDNIAWTEREAAQSLDFEAYDLMNERIKNSEPGAGGLLFLPYLMGERSPHWNPKARGAFIGLSMNSDRGDVMRAVMEGVTFNLRIILDSFEKEMSFAEMKVIGGGAESEVWRQIMADIYQKEIHRLQILREAPSLGAAVIGGVGTDIFPDFSVIHKFNPALRKTQPDPESREIYEKIYPLFRRSYQALTGIYDDLDELSL